MLLLVSNNKRLLLCKKLIRLISEVIWYNCRHERQTYDRLVFMHVIIIESFCRSKIPHDHIDGLVQDCSNSIVNALELLQSCTMPSIYDYHGNATRYMSSGQKCRTSYHIVLRKHFPQCIYLVLRHTCKEVIIDVVLWNIILPIPFLRQLFRLTA